MKRNPQAGRLAIAVSLAVLAAGCSERTSQQIADAPVVRDQNNQPMFDFSHVETEPVNFEPTKAEPMFPPPGGGKRQPADPYRRAAYRAPSEPDRAYYRAQQAAPEYRPDNRYVPPEPGYRSAAPQPVEAAPVADPDPRYAPQQAARPYSPPAQSAAPVPRKGDHVVRPGESLGAIAQGNDVSVGALAEANGLSAPFILTAGQALTIPGAGGTRTVSEAGGYHTVKSGDTVYGIARQNGVDLKEFMQVNGIVPPYTISPGQRLALPGRRVVQQQSAAAEPFDGIVPLSARVPALSDGPVQLPAVPNRIRDKLKLPVDGPVVARFGALPNGGQTDGMVFAASEGTQIVSAENGVVAYAGNGVAGYGNMAMVMHEGGWTTVYAHADRLFVRRGETVSRGQPIATVGSTGSATSPVLLFELRYGPDPVDPEPYFDTPRQEVSMR